MAPGWGKFWPPTIDLLTIAPGGVQPHRLPHNDVVIGNVEKAVVFDILHHTDHAQDQILSEANAGASGAGEVAADALFQQVEDVGIQFGGEVDVLQGQHGFGESVAVFAFGKAGFFDGAGAQFILQFKPFPNGRSLRINGESPTQILDLDKR